ncbi:hypothetical protein D9M69_227320 [compost metagenome]
MIKRFSALSGMPLQALGLLVCSALPFAAQAAESPAVAPYEFHNGFPTRQTVDRVYDEIDLNRAVQAYRFFYPSVSMYALWKNQLAAGVVPNQTFNLVRGNPKRLAFTANSDTPYGSLLLDLSAGPLVVELPPGPLMCVSNDLNQRWVGDFGLPGADAGKGGKHLILPPGYEGEVPEGYYVHTSSTNGLLLLLRAMPRGGVQAAFELMKTVKVHPLDPSTPWKEPVWNDLGDAAGDSTVLKSENSMDYWKLLHELIDKEPAFEPYRNYYGEIAALGIVKGKSFAPDERMQRILTRAAQMGNVQMRVQSLADRRADRAVWPDRQWEWAVLRPENGTFDMPTYADLEAREKWFYQAMVESPAMFRRVPGAGSLYWLGARDGKGEYLDGSKTYKLSVPVPLPAKLFWSVTVYDSDTRSQIQTEQNQAALRSLYDLKDAGQNGTVDLYFGPEAPQGQEKHWIKTTPGKGWFTYFRIYGPEKAAFDGSWKPGDFEQLN